MQLQSPIVFLNGKPKILLIGAGGTGSELLSRLYKLHALLTNLGGESFDLTVADGDLVSEFNIGRQNFYHCDIGLNKAEVLVNRFNAFANTTWEYIDHYLEKDDFNSNIGNAYDLIITCIDNGRFRAEIGEHFKQDYSEALWLDGGNDSHTGQIVIGHLANHSNNKIPNIYDLFGSELKLSNDGDNPSCSTEEAIQKQTFGVNSQVAEIMSQLIWQLFRNQHIKQHIAYVDVSSLNVSSIDACKEQWKLYGYS